MVQLRLITEMVVQLCQTAKQVMPRLLLRWPAEQVCRRVGMLSRRCVIDVS